jgi:hypothetical protein
MISFKTPRIQNEWVTLEAQNLTLHGIIKSAALFVKLNFNKDLTITEIMRTAAENAALYAPGSEPQNRPHTVWRAVDLRSSTFTQTEIQQLLTFLNQYKVFGGLKKCAIYHQIKNGAPHFHIQA